MNHDTLERYLDTMPEEAVDSMLELANEQRWAVLLALIAKNRMYFNEIKEEFDAAPAQVDTALKHLVAGGLVARQIGDLGDIGEKGKTFYTPTPLGRAVVRAVTDAFLPPEPVQVALPAPSYDATGWRASPKTYSGVGMPTVIGTSASGEKPERAPWRQRQAPRSERRKVNV